MVVGATALLASGAFWSIKTINNKIVVPSYRALRVIDGDTFETTERQLVRLTGINAPDEGNCGYDESSESLKKLVMNRNLYLKVIFRDRTNRLVAHVYNENGLVSTQMTKLGMAYYSGEGLKDEETRLRANEAKEKGVGIFGEKCTQHENKVNPKCVIKGNIRIGGDGRQYRFPGCGEYNSTIIQLYMGDSWFCSEKEAVEAGFTKGSDCFKKVWK